MSFLLRRQTGKRAGQVVEVMGDATADPPPSLHDLLNSDFVSTVSAVALTFHGYKRTGSLLWALAYGLAGKTFPIEAVPIAIAQGFGTKKACP